MAAMLCTNIPLATFCLIVRHSSKLSTSIKKSLQWTPNLPEQNPCLLQENFQSMFAFHSDSRGEMGERSAAQKRPLPPPAPRLPHGQGGGSSDNSYCCHRSDTFLYRAPLWFDLSLCGTAVGLSLSLRLFRHSLFLHARCSLSTRVFCLAFWGFAVLSEPGFDMLHLGQVSNRQKHYQFDFTVQSGRSGVMWSSHANSSPREVDWSEYRRSIESKRNLNRNKFN